MSILLAAFSLRAGPVVTLSGETAIDSSQTEPDVAIAGVRINTDGTLDKITGTEATPVYTQIDALTDYVIPNAAAPGAYQFQCTDNNANLDAGSDATGSWQAISLGAQLYYVTADATTTLLDIDLDVRQGTGATLDTGNYTGTAESNP